MFLLNNVVFDIHTQRNIGNTQYPAGWFIDPIEREKIGVIEVTDIPQPDDRVNIVTKNTDGTWTLIPRTQEDLARIAMEEKVSNNAEIIAAMDAADIKAIRYILEGNTTRIEMHRVAQAALRATLK